jgi:hypothetical protein
MKTIKNKKPPENSGMPLGVYISSGVLLAPWSSYCGSDCIMQSNFTYCNIKVAVIGMQSHIFWYTFIKLSVKTATCNFMIEVTLITRFPSLYYILITTIAQNLRCTKTSDQMHWSCNREQYPMMAILTPC